jgi:hypothetical protein
LPADRNDISAVEQTNKHEKRAQVGDENARDDSGQKATLSDGVVADATDSPPSRSSNDKYGIAPAEWAKAQRAARTASWGAIFYLITTDILGPFSIPWAIAVG